jgi:hypothetical protein
VYGLRVCRNGLQTKAQVAPRRNAISGERVVVNSFASLAFLAVKRTSCVCPVTSDLRSSSQKVAARAVGGRDGTIRSARAWQKECGGSFAPPELEMCVTCTPRSCTGLGRKVRERDRELIRLFAFVPSNNFLRMP